MNGSVTTVEVVPCGSSIHLEDLRQIRECGLPVPHLHSDWTRNSTSGTWLWCRVMRSERRLVTAFALELTPSHLPPGMQIGRVDRLGRALHKDLLYNLGEVLKALAKKIPRLLLLYVRVVDEDDSRRERYGRALQLAGAQRVDPARDYEHTVTLPIHDLEETRRTLLTRRMRSEINRFLRHPGTRIERIPDHRYLERVSNLLRESFARTGEGPPLFDIEGVFNDAAANQESILLGAFVSGRRPPDDLVAFAWGRLNGDHVVYDTGGSEKTPEMRHMSAGYALVWQLAGWGKSHGATWMDLGGVIGGRADDTPLVGIDTFKRRFSDNEHRIAEEFVVIPQTILATTVAAIRRVGSRIRRPSPTKETCP